MLTTILVGCKKDDDVEDAGGFDGSIEDIEDFYNSDIVDALLALGFDINTGNNPPNIEGSYLVSSAVLQNSSVPGDTNGTVFPNLLMNFNNQEGELLTIDFDGSSGVEIYNGDGSFISGDNNEFSVFLKIIAERSGQTAETTFAISGVITNEGISDVQVAVLMIDDEGDPGGIFIENNTGRVLFDGDGLAERI